MIGSDLPFLRGVGAPVPGGRPNAEPGGGRQRRREAPRLIGLNWTSAGKGHVPPWGVAFDLGRGGRI
jgi:hypothetical protein